MQREKLTAEKKRAGVSRGRVPLQVQPAQLAPQEGDRVRAGTGPGNGDAHGEVGQHAQDVTARAAVPDEAHRDEAPADRHGFHVGR